MLYSHALHLPIRQQDVLQFITDAQDPVTGLAFTTVDELMAWMEAHPL